MAALPLSRWETGEGISLITVGGGTGGRRRTGGPRRRRRRRRTRQWRPGWYWLCLVVVLVLVVLVVYFDFRISSTFRTYFWKQDDESCLICVKIFFILFPRLNKAYFKELLSSHYGQTDLKVRKKYFPLFFQAHVSPYISRRIYQKSKPPSPPSNFLLLFWKCARGKRGVCVPQGEKM